MSDQAGRAAIERYLRRVEAELTGLPSSAQEEILSDLRSHVEEALAEEPSADEATVRTVLDRMGQPEELAREARERLGVVAELPVRRSPGLLEIAAIALTWLIWPIGIALAWASPRWRVSDKAIASVIPVLGTLVLLGSVLVALTGVSVSPEVRMEAVQVVDGDGTPREVIVHQPERPSVLPQILALALIVVSLATPLFSAILLAVRIDRDDSEQQRRWIPAAVGT